MMSDPDIEDVFDLSDLRIDLRIEKKEKYYFNKFCNSKQTLEVFIHNFFSKCNKRISPDGLDPPKRCIVALKPVYKKQVEDSETGQFPHYGLPFDAGNGYIFMQELIANFGYHLLIPLYSLHSKAAKLEYCSNVAELLGKEIKLVGEDANLPLLGKLEDSNALHEDSLIWYRILHDWNHSTIDEKKKETNDRKHRQDDVLYWDYPLSNKINETAKTSKSGHKLSESKALDIVVPHESKECNIENP